MLEESFAQGESFSCFEEGVGFSESPRRPFRERPDISSVLVIEEDEDSEVQELQEEEEEDEDESKLYELERQAQKMTLKPQASNLSVEARQG